MPESALTGLIETGTHRTKWILSKPPDTDSWEAAGDVQLPGLRQPEGAVYGTAPVNWTGSGGQLGAGFPQHFDYPLVYGEMDGGLDVVLLDAHLTVMGEEPRSGTGFISFKGPNASFDAWCALVGYGAPRSGPLLVDSGTIQVPHLEALAAKSPLAEVGFPRDNLWKHDEPKFSATIDKDSVQQWRDDGAEVTCCYQMSADVTDSYL